LSFSAARSARRRDSAAYWRKRVASFSMTVGCPKFHVANRRTPAPVPAQIYFGAGTISRIRRFTAHSLLGRNGRAALMRKAEDYRRYAAECLRLAQELQTGPKGAALLLEMAERWRRLAERAERRELVSERRN
jgi:hypothetical protein